MKNAALIPALILSLGLAGCNYEAENIPAEISVTETTPETEAAITTAETVTTPAPVTTAATKTESATEAVTAEETEREFIDVKGINTDLLKITNKYDVPAIGEEASKAIYEWRKNNSILNETASYCIIGDYTVFIDYAAIEMENGSRVPISPCPHIAVVGNGKVTEIDDHELFYASGMELYYIKDNVFYYYAEGAALGWEHFFFAEFSLEDGSKINEFYETYPLGSGKRDNYINTYHNINSLKDLEAYALSISEEWYRDKSSDILYDDIK